MKFPIKASNSMLVQRNRCQRNHIALPRKNGKCVIKRSTVFEIECKLLLILSSDRTFSFPAIVQFHFEFTTYFCFANAILFHFIIRYTAVFNGMCLFGVEMTQPKRKHENSMGYHNFSPSIKYFITYISTMSWCMSFV